MGARHSASALKRWRRTSERRRASQVIRARIRPHSVTEITRPPEVTRFVRLFDDEPAIDVVDCSPTFLRGGCWKVALVDASCMASGDRYDKFAARAGVVVYEYLSKPLRSGAGISVAVVVGLRR